MNAIEQIRKWDLGPEVHKIEAGNNAVMFVLVHKGKRIRWMVTVTHFDHIRITHSGEANLYYTPEDAKLAVDSELKEYVDVSYTCGCGKEWAENELYATLDNNEDWVVYLESLNSCPDCYEGELS